MKRGFASFCNILISLVPYSYSSRALTYPQGADEEVSLPSGVAWVMLERAGRGDGGVRWWEGTRWHLLAEAKQELHKSTQS